MPNATINTLIGQIATVSLSSTPLNNYQDELIRELARGALPNAQGQTEAAFVGITEGVSLYTIPFSTTALRTILMLFFDEQQLGLTSYEEAQAFDPSWRARFGKPIVYLLETIDRTKFLLIPTPDEDSGSPGLNTPVSITTTYPTGIVTIIGLKANLAYDETTLTDTFLPFAFTVLAREMGRDSDHIDPEMSAAAQQMATFLWQMSYPEGVNG